MRPALAVRTPGPGSAALAALIISTTSCLALASVPSNAPTSVQVRFSNYTAIELRWDKIVDNVWIFYQFELLVQPSSDECRNGNISQSGTTNSTETLFTGLTPYCYYSISVKGCTNAKCGPAAALDYFVSDQKVPTSAPTCVQVTFRNSTTIELQWNKMREHVGIVYRHELVGQPSDECRFSNNSVHEEKNLMWILYTGLKPFCTYSISVRGCTNVGCGPAARLNCLAANQTGNESLCRNVNPLLQAVNLTIFSEDTALKSLGIIYNFTSAISNITKTDFEFVADSLNFIAQSMVPKKVNLTIVGVTQVSTDFAGIVDNIMNPDFALASGDAEVLDATRRLTSNMEVVLQSLMQVLSDSSDTSSVSKSVEEDKRHMAYRVIHNSSIVGVYVCVGENSSLKLYYLTNESRFSQACTAIASIKLPDQLLDSTKAFISYSNSRLFDGAQNDAESAKGQVLGSLLGRNVKHEKLDDDVILQFDVSHIKVDRRRLGCAFWDYSQGNWSFNGCSSFLNDNSIECRCNHLTHFAVLLDWRTTVVAAPREALTIISRVGLSVSTVGLGLVIVTFILFRSMRRTTSQRVLFNLALSLAGLNLCFLVGFDLTDNHTVCTAMAAATHYFLLSSFAWMLVEGVLQYLRLVKVLNTYVPNFVLKASVPSWGVPAVAVVVLVVTDSQHYLGYDASEALQQCWVSKPVLLYAVVVPIGAIVLTNIIIFILIACSLRRGSPLKLRSNRSEREVAILHLKASISILILLGITWIFGLLVFENDHVTLVFQYLFCIINSLQGLMIFVLHNVREPFARKQWRTLCFPSANSRRDSTAMTSSSSQQPRTGTASSTISQRR